MSLGFRRRFCDRVGSGVGFILVGMRGNRILGNRKRRALCRRDSPGSGLRLICSGIGGEVWTLKGSINLFCHLHSGGKLSDLAFMAHLRHLYRSRVG